MARGATVWQSYPSACEVNSLTGGGSSCQHTPALAGRSCDTCSVVGCDHTYCSCPLRVCLVPNTPRSGKNCFDASMGSGVLFCRSTPCRGLSFFSSPPPPFTSEWGSTIAVSKGWRGICGGSLVCLVVSHLSKRAGGSSIALARRQMSQVVLRSCRQEACLSYRRHLSGRLFPTVSFPFAASSASSFSSGKPPPVYRARTFLPGRRFLSSRG